MALAPMTVFSAGLGKLNVSSGLGEPLRADIELLSVTPEELNSIFAVIASEEAYANQGIDRPASHSTIKVEVSKNANGTPILKLKSTQPISEPFLDMLIQVDWGSGRLLREYTVLLDPPGYTSESDNSAQSSQDNGQATQLPTVKAANQSQQDSISNEAASAKKSSSAAKASPPKKSEAVQTASENDASTQEYLTQRGDSLAKIARDMQVEGVSLDQMLVALYQANPNAFDGKNMNRLKVGKIIRPPSEQELAGLSRQQASKEVKVQSANWNEYRNKLAGIVAESAPTESEASWQSADGKIKSAAEDQSMSSATGPKDVVKLSAGEAALTKKDAEDIKGLQAKITALQEETTAREKTVQEAQDKTAALEKQIADMQQLLALRNNTMSDMQKQAEVQASPDTSNNQQSQSDTPIVAEEAKPAQVVPAEVAVTDQAAQPVANASQEKPKPAPVIVTEPAAEPSLLDGLDLPLLGAGAGLLAVLGGVWMFLRNKRKRNLADFEQGIMTSGGLKANTVFGNTSGSSVDTGDTSFLTDFSQSANGGMIDTNDVDPIAEAEVYMAYGRDAQAEEILKDAISKEPKRYELHLKLLEMYAASKNVSAFETIAGELYTTLGAEDSTWLKVAEIGYKLEPSNPLYQANTAHTSVARSSDEKLDANDFSDSPIASETDLDFSFDNDSLMQNSASSSNEKDAFDLDLDALNSGTSAASAESLSSDANAENIEFSMNSPATESLIANTIENLNQPAQVQAMHADVSAPEMMHEAIKNDDSLDFDFGELTASVEDASSQDGANFGHTMPGLDMSGFEAPKLAAEDVPAANVVDSEISESFELPMLEEASIDKLATEVSFDAVEASDMESDFNFDLSTVSPEASSYVEDEASAANTYDLSSISLDMPDTSMQVESPVISAVDEPVEIETKLDLVAAYIEMDDAEGAKELLEEVMKEGGASQRKRAEALLAKLG